MATHQQVRNHFKDELVSSSTSPFVSFLCKSKKTMPFRRENRSKFRQSTSSIPAKRLGNDAACGNMLKASSSMPTVLLRTLYPMQSILQGSDDFGAFPQVTELRRWHRSRDGQLAAVPESQAALPTCKMWTTPVNAGAAKSQSLVEDGHRKLR